MLRVASLLLLCTILPLVGVAGADGDPDGVSDHVAVPDVRGLDARDAVRVLVDAGLEPGRLFDKAGLAPLGTVMQQAPPPHTQARPSRRPAGSRVHLRIAAAVDGSPAGRDVPVAWRSPRPDVPASALPPPRVDLLRAGEPLPDAPAPPTGADRRRIPPEAAVGSPDGDPVPALEGLELVEAEQLCRALGFQLHVERVAGHPVGRVLGQVPAAFALRPHDGWVRVQVAAGGDRPAAIAPAPTVAVTRLAVPDLLDRTWPQAKRILEEMGFVARREEAAHGPAGRVADQAPAPGLPLERGGTVLVRIAPASRSPVQPLPRPTPPAAAPPATAAPRPIAPRPGVELGDGATLLLGFSWHPVADGGAYLLEVEEALADGWVGIARQVVRRPGVLVELERLGDPPGALRWRVTAVREGRPEAGSAWLELR